MTCLFKVISSSSPFSLDYMENTSNSIFFCLDYLSNQD